MGIGCRGRGLDVDGSMEWNGHPNDGHGIGQLAVGVNRHGKDFGIVMVVGVGFGNPIQWLLLGFGRLGFGRKGIGEVGEIWN